MLGGMTAKQFREWQVYDELEPSESVRRDWRHAALMALLANQNRGKGRAPYKMADFVLRFGDDAKPAGKMDWKTQKGMMKMLFGPGKIQKRDGTIVMEAPVTRGRNRTLTRPAPTRRPVNRGKHGRRS